MVVLIYETKQLKNVYVNNPVPKIELIKRENPENGEIDCLFYFIYGIVPSNDYCSLFFWFACILYIYLNKIK